MQIVDIKNLIIRFTSDSEWHGHRETFDYVLDHAEGNGFELSQFFDAINELIQEGFLDIKDLGIIHYQRSQL